MRILAGVYKGRELLSPPGQSETRPVTGSVKKSLFGMLGEYLSGQMVVDLYCGTGTMGIEALSRGAERCYFAERDRRVVQALEKNLHLLGAAEQGVIWRGDIQAKLPQWLATLPRPADVVFVDPPYAQVSEWDWETVTRTIFAPLAARLADDGVAVLRVPGKTAVPPRLGPLGVLREKDYGDMIVAMLGKPLARRGEELTP